MFAMEAIDLLRPLSLGMRVKNDGSPRGQEAAPTALGDFRSAAGGRIIGEQCK